MKRCLSFLALLALTGAAWAQAPEPRQRQQQAIEPRLDRPQITIPGIESGDFELNLFTGLLGIEYFGTEVVYGVRGAYHLTEDLFLEASYGRSEISDEAYRRIGVAIPLFEGGSDDVEYYNLSVAWNALPGEVFFGGNRAYTSGLFLLAGVGNTSVAWEDFFTVNLGVGFRVLPTDSVSLRLELRDHVFENDLLGQSTRTHNLELTAGIGVYF